MHRPAPASRPWLSLLAGVGLAGVLPAPAARAAAEPVPWEDRNPALQSWQGPAYPPALAREAREGSVSVRFVVDDQGRVTDATVLQSFDPRADAAALDAVRGWRFQPATVAGDASASCLEANTSFRLHDPAPAPPALPAGAELPQATKKTPPEPLSKPDPVYPAEFMAQRISGDVLLLLKVDAKGKVVDSRLLNAANPAFVREASDAVRTWTFKPAREGDLILPALVEADIVFQPK